jgi:hypothetical protein
MSKHIYVYTYMSIYIYTYTHIYVYICVYIYIYIHTWVYTYTHICIYMYIYIYEYIQLYVHMCMYIYVCMPLLWWWTEELSETCRVLFQKYIWETSASSWFDHKNISRCTVSWTSNTVKITVANRLGTPVVQRPKINL